MRDLPSKWRGPAIAGGLTLVWIAYVSTLDACADLSKAYDQQCRQFAAAYYFYLWPVLFAVLSALVSLVRNIAAVADKGRHPIVAWLMHLLMTCIGVGTCAAFYWVAGPLWDAGHLRFRYSDEGLGALLILTIAGSSLVLMLLVAAVAVVFARRRWHERPELAGAKAAEVEARRIDKMRKKRHW